MGELISLEAFKAAKLESQSKKLLKISEEIDGVIISNVHSKVELLDIAGLLAHRLGTLVAQLTSKAEKERLAAICVGVINDRVASRSQT